MLNINRPRYKRSKLERALNRDVLCCVALLFSMCLVGAVGRPWIIRISIKSLPCPRADRGLSRGWTDGFLVDVI